MTLHVSSTEYMEPTVSTGATLRPLSDQSNAADFEFLAAEVKRGLSLLDVADFTSNPKTQRQVSADAAKIYHSIPCLPPTCASTIRGTALLEELKLLRMRLVLAGYWSLLLPGSLSTRGFRDLLVAPRRPVGVLLGMFTGPVQELPVRVLTFLHMRMLKKPAPQA